MIVCARRVKNVDRWTTHSHLPRRSLNLDLVWSDQLRLEFAPPLDGTLDALVRVVKLPLGSTQVPWQRVWFVKPTALPRRIGVPVWEVKRVGVLDKRRDR